MRRVPINQIRQNHTYAIQEVAMLLDVHKNTVRRWIGEGLPIIDKTRPILIHGSELKPFLAKRKEDARVKCLPHEFYCLKCRAARTAWEAQVDIKIRSQNLFNVQGLCTVCGTPVHKAAGQKKLAEILKMLVVQQVQPEHLIVCLAGV